MKKFLLYWNPNGSVVVTDSSQTPAPNYIFLQEFQSEDHLVACLSGLSQSTVAAVGLLLREKERQKSALQSELTATRSYFEETVKGKS